MEEIAAELAVGDRLEPESLLPFDEVGDRRILDRAQGRIIDIVRGAVLARLDDGARTQEGADVVGAGRQLGAHDEVLCKAMMGLGQGHNAGLALVRPAFHMAIVRRNATRETLDRTRAQTVSPAYE